MCKKLWSDSIILITNHVYNLCHMHSRFAHLLAGWMKIIDNMSFLLKSYIWKYGTWLLRSPVILYDKCIGSCMSYSTLLCIKFAEGIKYACARYIIEQYLLNPVLSMTSKHQGAEYDNSSKICGRCFHGCTGVVYGLY